MKLTEQQKDCITTFGMGVIIALLFAIGAMGDRFNDHLNEHQEAITTSQPMIIINIGE